MRVFCTKFSKTFLTPPHTLSEHHPSPRRPPRALDTSAFRARPRSGAAAPSLLAPFPDHRHAHRAGHPGRPRVSPPATRASSSAPASSLLARRVVRPFADESPPPGPHCHPHRLPAAPAPAGARGRDSGRRPRPPPGDRPTTAASPCVPPPPPGSERPAGTSASGLATGRVGSGRSRRCVPGARGE